MIYNHNLNHNKTHQSSNIIVNILNDIYKPKSVLDVGCGVGNFLYSFKNHGVKEVLGIDGEWATKINETFINLKKTEFYSVNLNENFELNLKFDLTLCLEVAEHLNPDRAESFIRNLCNTSDLIAFSAAVPLQGGQNHLNEKPQSFWCEIFSKHGYYPIDIRNVLWNLDIDYFYKQNLIIYSKNINNNTKNINLDIIHPELFKEKTRQLYLIQYGKLSLKEYLKIVLKPIYYKFKKITYNYNN